MPTKVTRYAADVVEWIVRATARVGVRPCLPEVVGVHAQGALEAERRQQRAETLRARPSAVMTPRKCAGSPKGRQVLSNQRPIAENLGSSVRPEKRSPELWPSSQLPNRYKNDGENIENTLGNHARLPKQCSQTTLGKFDSWLKGCVNRCSMFDVPRSTARESARRPSSRNLQSRAGCGSNSRPDITFRPQPRSRGVGAKRRRLRSMPNRVL